MSKHYTYVRINLKNAHGRESTISIPPDQYHSLALLARGSATKPITEYIADVCRESARELLADGKYRKLSAAVRARTFSKLRSAYREHRAVAFDQAQFPEGTPIAA